MEHELMCRSTQRKMLRLVVQAKREYRKKNTNANEEKDMTEDERNDNGPLSESE